MGYYETNYELNKIDKLAGIEKKNKDTFYRNNKFYGFKKITDKRKEELESQIFIFDTAEIMHNSKIGKMYVFLNDPKWREKVGVSLDDESYLFLILGIDPDLKLLQMFYEESNAKVIAKRFVQEFGFSYDSRLLEIEKYYNKRFPTLADQFEIKK